MEARYTASCTKASFSLPTWHSEDGLVLIARHMRLKAAYADSALLSASSLIQVTLKNRYPGRARTQDEHPLASQALLRLTRLHSPQLAALGVPL